MDGGKVGTTASAAGFGEVVTLRPGRPFDLVGFRWRGLAVPSISVQSLGARGWSRWVDVDTAGEDSPDRVSLIGESQRGGGKSGAVWTGESRALRIRVRGNAPALRAHFVRVTIPDRGALRSVGAAATGGVGPGSAKPKNTSPAPAPVPSPTKPSPPKSSGNNPPPPIVTRADWGADQSCKPRVTPSYGEVLGITVHHTTSTNNYSATEAPGVVLGICRYHRNSNGWNDIGYNLLVDRFGAIYEGRAGGTELPVVGAHSEGYNMQMAGIALVGSFVTAKPSAAAMGALRAVVKWKLGLAGVTRAEGVALVSAGGSRNLFPRGKLVFVRPVSGHRDLDSTACPGGALFGLIPTVAPFLAAGARAPSRMSLRVALSASGTAATVAGRLRGKGRALAGQRVEIQAYSSVGWVKVTEATTDAAGVWTASVAPLEPQFVRGVFSGSNNFRPVRSPWKSTPKLIVPARKRRR